MPIYAYKCASCGFAKDVLQKMSDAPLTQCPSCGQSSFSKQVTAAGFQLKGSGWYVTDFRGGNNGAPAAAAPAGEGGAGAAAAADGAGKSPDSTAGKSESTKADSPKTESASPKKADAAPSTGSAS